MLVVTIAWVQSIYVFPTVLWSCVSLLTLVGLGLLIWGLRGRRLGDEPHCRRCGYILLQAASGRCPECGSPFSPASVRRGTRHRLWIRAGIGASVVILAVMMVYGPAANFIRQHNWYQHKPSAWVLSDLDSSLYIESGNMLRYRAVHELVWRDSVGRLDDATRKKFIERSLQECAATAKRSIYMDYLAESLVLGRLDDQQIQTFMDFATRLSIKATPIIGEGDEIAYSIEHQDRSLGVEKGLVSLFLHRGDCRIDGKTVTPPEQEERYRVFLPGGSIGEHTIEQDMSCTLSYLQTGSSTFREMGRARKTLITSYKVVPREQAPAVKLLASAELHNKVAKTVKANSVSTHWFYTDAKPRDPVLFGTVGIELSTIPCDLAFDVLLVVNGQQKAMGQIWGAKGDYAIRYTESQVERRLPDKVGVILRPSASLARRIPGAQEIYGKELAFADVPVKQDWTAADTQPSPREMALPDADHPIILEELWGNGAKVALGWRANRNDAGFEIWRSAKEDFSDAKKVGETSPGETAFVDRVPDAGQQYYYRVYFREDASTTQPVGDKPGQGRSGEVGRFPPLPAEAFPPPSN